MPREELDAAATPDRIARLVAAGALQGEDVPRAFAAASATPPRAEWAKLVDRTLLLLGALLSVAGVVFFFAFNWAKIPAFAKFAIIGGAITGSVVVSHLRTLDRPSGKAALLVAALLIGPLLAVYGQHYQTGADPYQLFFAWAALAVPWAIAARSDALWGIWIAIADTAAVLFVEQGLDAELHPWASGAELPLVAAVHLIALVACEARSRGDGKQSRTLSRVIALFGVGALSIGAVAWVLSWGSRWHTNNQSLMVCGLLMPLAWCGLMAAYREHRRDLAMLAMLGASLVFVVTTAFAKVLDEIGWDKVAIVLVVGLVLVGEVACLAMWLRSEAKRTGSGRADG